MSDLAIDGYASGSGATSSVTCSLTTTSGTDTVIVVVAAYSGTAGLSLATPTWGFIPLSFTQIGSTVTMGSGPMVALGVYRCNMNGVTVAPASIAGNSTGGTPLGVDIIAFAVFGGDQEFPLDINVSLPATATGSTSAVSVTFSTTATNTMVVLAQANDSGLTGTVGTISGSPATLIADQDETTNNKIDGAAQYRILSSPQTAQTATYTTGLGVANWAAMVIALVAAPSTPAIITESGAIAYPGSSVTQTGELVYSSITALGRILSSAATSAVTPASIGVGIHATVKVITQSVKGAVGVSSSGGELLSQQVVKGAVGSNVSGAVLLLTQAVSGSIGVNQFATTSLTPDIISPALTEVGQLAYLTITESGAIAYPEALITSTGAIVYGSILPSTTTASIGVSLSAHVVVSQIVAGELAVQQQASPKASLQKVAGTVGVSQNATIKAALAIATGSITVQHFAVASITIINQATKGALGVGVSAAVAVSLEVVAGFVGVNESATEKASQAVAGSLGIAQVASSTTPLAIVAGSLAAGIAAVEGASQKVAGTVGVKLLESGSEIVSQIAAGALGVQAQQDESLILLSQAAPGAIGLSASLLGGTFTTLTSLTELGATVFSGSDITETGRIAYYSNGLDEMGRTVSPLRTYTSVDFPLQAVPGSITTSSSAGEAVNQIVTGALGISISAGQLTPTIPGAIGVSIAVTTIVLPLQSALGSIGVDSEVTGMLFSQSVRGEIGVRQSISLLLDQAVKASIGVRILLTQGTNGVPVAGSIGMSLIATAAFPLQRTSASVGLRAATPALLLNQAVKGSISVNIRTTGLVFSQAVQGVLNLAAQAQVASIHKAGEMIAVYLADDAPVGVQVADGSKAGIYLADGADAEVRSTG